MVLFNFSCLHYTLSLPKLLPGPPNFSAYPTKCSFSLKKNKQNQNPKKKKKTQKKIANQSEWQKNTKTKQHKRTEPWNLAMLLSYTWAWGLRWLNKANAHMKPETWQHAQGLHQLRTDSWREAGTSSAFECVTPSGALSLPL